MNRASKAKTREVEEEVERRMEALFAEIFPKHAQCGNSCLGHQLPNMATRFLKEMEYPADLKRLTIAARSWFERIDLDASNRIEWCNACLQAHTHTHTSGGKGGMDISECMCVQDAHMYTSRTRTHARTLHAYACTYGQGGTYQGIRQNRHHSICRILAVELS
jgi:hypothetical protein